MNLCFEKNEAGQLVDLKAGAWSEAAWEFEGWGNPFLRDFTVVSVTSDTLKVDFWTKGLPIGALVQAMGQEFPTLDFRLVALDDGDEYPYLAISAGGTFSEQKAEATEEFMVEIEGKPRELDVSETEPSVIQPWPVTHIRWRLAERKLLRTLAGYPAYEPPFVGHPTILASEQVEENFERFMKTRDTRMGQLRTFLKKFQVDINPADANLRKLDRWMATYGAFLAVRETGSTFTTHVPAWREARIGYNVMFDLATFLGDLVILRNPGFRWELYIDVPPGLRKSSSFYRALVVRGPNPTTRLRLWPFNSVHDVCRALREMKFMWKKPSFTMAPPEAVNKFFSYEVAKVAEWASRPPE